MSPNLRSEPESPVRRNMLVSFTLLTAATTVAHAFELLRSQRVSHIIIEHATSGTSRYYLFTRKETLLTLRALRTSIPETTLQEVLCLTHNPAEPVIDLTATHPPDRAIILNGNRVIGFLDMEWDTRFEGGDRGTETTSGGWGDPVPDPVPNGGDPETTMDPTRFSAYPTLNAPAQVHRNERFTVTVGLSEQLDSQLTAVGKINVPRLPDEQLLVALYAQGADIIGARGQPLPLDLTETVAFTCQPLPDVTKATITADYYYNYQLVGTATRNVKIVNQPAQLSDKARRSPLRSCTVETPGADALVDLTVTIRVVPTQPARVTWDFVARNPKIEIFGIETTLINSRAFAANLIADLAPYNYKGALAVNQLEVLGQQIAANENMPEEFWQAVADVYAALGRVPTILLHTNDTYVPWELAVMPEPLDDTIPPFLSAQTAISRWIDDANITKPPTHALQIQHCSVVASAYGDGSGYPGLPEALAEQTALQSFFEQAQLTAHSISATSDELDALLLSEVEPGHLLHLAVHGRSDPATNNQRILLANGRQVRTAGAFVGRYKCGADPRFAFVFFNACQVGTPGESLGAAAGFPGDFVRGGVSGFIAPLWNVNDLQARELAQALYLATLDQPLSVAEFLRKRRAEASSDTLVGALAYIFYGHPALTLKAK